MEKWFYFGINLQKMTNALDTITMSARQPNAQESLNAAQQSCRNLKYTACGDGEYGDERYDEYKTRLRELYNWYMLLSVLKDNPGVDLPEEFNLHIKTADNEEFEDY
jgi:hypothetical protein